jgi:membrane protein
MASLRDVGPVLRSCGWWTFLKRVWNQTNEDDIFVWASALAYSWLFAVFPFLILILSLVPYLPRTTRDNATHAITQSISTMLGKEAETINANVISVVNNPRKGWLGVGLVVSLWVASGGMSMTMSALDKCYEVKKPRSYIHHRIVAIAITVAVIVCVLIIIVLLPIGEIFGRWATSRGFISWPLRIAFDIARYIVSIWFSIFVLGIIYHFGPNVRQPFHFLSPGAVFCTVIWFLLNIVFRIYIDRFARYDQTYGTVGGAAILLLFFYIDAVVMLVGAEINSEIDFERLGVAARVGDKAVIIQDSPPVPTMAKEL